MSSLGTVYAGVVLAVSVVFYLATRAWYGLDRRQLAGSPGLSSASCCLS